MDEEVVRFLRLFEIISMRYSRGAVFEQVDTYRFEIIGVVVLSKLDELETTERHSLFRHQRCKVSVLSFSRTGFCITVSP